MRIEDGAGSGIKAKVNSDQRLEVDAVTESRQEFHNQKGKGFIIDSNLISLTTTGESQVLFIQNTGDKDLIIDNIWLNFDVSTGGTGRVRVALYSNVTAGTIVSSALAPLGVQNLNFGSSTTLEANVYKGVTGSTRTDGTLFAYFVRTDEQSGRFYLLDLDRNTFVLPKGTSLCISVTPPGGNSAQTVSAGMIVYENNIED